MATPAAVGRRTQAQRSAETRQRLVDAAIAALIEHGYAGTTAVEVCRRAGVTRGAFQHHFPSLAALLVEVLERLYARLRPDGEAPSEVGAEAFIRSAWQRVARPEFKAVIEIWLAARNDPALGSELAPAIAQLAGVFSPDENPRLAELLGAEPEWTAFYRLACETMIGLALGRASSPDGAPVGHEDQVIELLTAMAREREGR